MEATYELLSLPLYRCSHKFQNISFTGARVLERSGETLTKQTPLDKYVRRPDNDDSSWYQFVCRHGRVPINSGSNRAVCPLTEEFARSVLLLHWPNWRAIADIKPADTTWLDVLGPFLQSEQCPNFVKADVERAQRHQSPDVADSENSDNDDEDCNADDEQPEWMTLMQPQKSFDEIPEHILYDDRGPDHNWALPSEEYPHGLGLKWLEQLSSVSQSDATSHITDSDVSIASMNKDQRFAFNIVMDTLIRHRKRPAATEPLRLIVTGTAGSGKSFLIKCLVHTIRTLYRNNKAVQVLCPTGNSANLISGRTIHSFLKVPTSFQATKDMKAPDAERGQTIQDNCQDVVALLVDERSLVGCKTLGWMEFLCRYGMNNMSSSWGATPVVVLLGDDVQHPPVMDSPVYMQNGKLCTAGMHGALVWKEFNHAIALQTIIRQNADQMQLKRVLMSLREYTLSKEDAQWLQKFQWDELKASHGVGLLTDMNKHGLFVFPTHAAEFEHNKTNLLMANEQAPVAKVVAVNTGAHSKGAPSDKTGGLLPVLHICKGAKVMLTCNLNVEFGLFNGSMGEVTDIIYLDGRKPEDSLPDVVMVSINKYTGPPFVEHKPTVVPLVPIERRVECGCYNCKRKQLPLRLGWGTTIHRCQGMTIGQGEPNRYIVIDPGTRKFESQTPGALFVALSRAKSAGGPHECPDFAWHPRVLVNEDRLCHVVNTATTKARRREIQRISQLADSTRTTFAQLDNESAFDDICSTVRRESEIAEE